MKLRNKVLSFSPTHLAYSKETGFVALNQQDANIYGQICEVQNFKTMEMALTCDSTISNDKRL